jgi:hypothetical protein
VLQQAVVQRAIEVDHEGVGGAGSWWNDPPALRVDRLTYVGADLVSPIECRS